MWRLLKWLSVLCLLVIIGLAVYCYTLSFQIEERFAGRRWQIPSKIFSDTTLLYPGQRMNRDLFMDKLLRLGYRQVPHAPPTQRRIVPAEYVMGIVSA